MPRFSSRQGATSTDDRELPFGDSSLLLLKREVEFPRIDSTMWLIGILLVATNVRRQIQWVKIPMTWFRRAKY